ncbi:hypothetical protein A6A40_03065 [Azospirillum humicireducens]|uniref:Uncharacterized protein n=1 Tax=Azospirillum humicireducens TaxID=1226968 RepID=A0A160JDY5_9PROT|nr:hypothetical protein [Azospirillum humicireducens]ANC90965.1 hypothetical protein A6A40_03065 [Azospirillum humicireducens]
MSLPTASFLDEMKSKCDQAVEKAGGKRPTLEIADKVLNFCSRNGSEILKMGGEMALQSGVTHLATASGVSSGVAIPHTAIPVVASGGVVFMPLGAALAPWIAAAKVASMAESVYDLHDLNDMAKGKRKGLACSCGNCTKQVGYAIDKKEVVAARIGVGVFTAGASEILYRGLYSFGKSIKSKILKETRPKETHAKALVESARQGCHVAMATILTLVGGDGKKAVRQAVTIIVCEDGWERLKSYM